MHPVTSVLFCLGGLFNMWTGNKNIAAVEKYIPTSYVDLYPGDVIYNPDWQWHKITSKKAM